MILGIEFGEANIIPVAASHISASTIVPLVRVTFDQDGEYARLDSEDYGTAFCIARLNAHQAVYLTARHTIRKLIGAPATNIAVMVPSAADPEVPTFIPVQYFGTRDTNLDIATFVLDFSEPIGGPANMPMTIDRWDFSEPRPGQNCVALGYGSPQTPPPDMVPGLHASRGTIKEVYPHLRDRGFLTFPSFMTNADFPHGMSGGPVFTDDDRLVAVVSAGFDTTRSYASLIQAATTLDVAFMDPSGERRELHIGDLIHSRQIDIGSSEAVVRQGSAGVRVSWDDVPPAPELTAMTIAEEIVAVYGLPAHDLIRPVERVEKSFAKDYNQVLASIRPRHAIQAFKDGRIDRYTFDGASVMLAAKQIDTSTPHTLLVYAKAVPEQGPAIISFAWRLYTDDSAAELSPTQLFDQMLTECGVELTCGAAQGVFIARVSGKDVFAPRPIEATYMTAEALIDVSPDGVRTVAWAFAIDSARYAAMLKKRR